MHHFLKRPPPHHFLCPSHPGTRVRGCRGVPAVCPLHRTATVEPACPGPAATPSTCEMAFLHRALLHVLTINGPLNFLY